MKHVVGNDPTKIANSISNGENFLEIKSRTIFFLLLFIIIIIIIAIIPMKCFYVDGDSNKLVGVALILPCLF